MFIAGVTTLYSQQNMSFEDWSQQDLFSTPDDWPFNVIAEGVPPHLYSTLSQSNDAYSGSYSLRLESIVNTNDTIFGFCLNGMPGDAGFSGGVPYTDMVDSVVIHYQCDLPSDSLTAIIMFKNMGSPVGGGVFTIGHGTTTSGTWAKATVPISLIASPDSVIVGFASADTGSISDESFSSGWALIDDVTFYSGGSVATDIPNHDFENWTTVSVEEPDNWSTLNGVSPSDPTVTKTTSSTEGLYGVRLETKNSAPGLLTNGYFMFSESDLAIQGAEYFNNPGAVPDSFALDFMYTPNGADTGWGYLVLINNSASNDTFYIQFNSQASYSTNNFALNLSVNPDSFLLAFFAGENDGSVLIIDHLRFIGGSVDISEFDTYSSKVFPNPSFNGKNIQITSNKPMQSIRLIDMSGRSVAFEQTFDVYQYSLNQKNLQAGSYILQIEDSGGKKENHKLVIQ